jgi:hypothetical protein
MNEKIKQLEGRTISKIECYEYLGRTGIEEIIFTDGSKLELSGLADMAAVDDVEINEEKQKREDERKKL